jgi:hypothetical protein
MLMLVSMLAEIGRSYPLLTSLPLSLFLSLSQPVIVSFCVLYLYQASVVVVGVGTEFIATIFSPLFVRSTK